MIYSEDGSLTYTLKRSKRAKYVRLKITRLKGLEIVVPETFQMSWLPDILKKREDWIAETAERLNISAPGGGRNLVPEKISLKAIGQEYDVVMASEDEINSGRVDAQKIIRTPTGLLAIERNNTIMLPEDASEEGHVELLKVWLVRSAKESLVDMLDAISRKTGIPYKKAQIRMQRTRWGSCSSRGGISLNARLILLPEEMATYIMYHELAHVRHPNHSAAYWSFLASLNSDALELDKEMRNAWQHLPICFSMA